MIGIEYTLRLSTRESIEIMELNEPDSKKPGSDHIIKMGFATVITNEQARDIRLGNDRTFKEKLQGEPVRCLTKVKPKKCVRAGVDCAQYKPNDCVTTALSRLPPCWESGYDDERVAEWLTFCVACWRSGQWVVLVRD